MSERECPKCGGSGTTTLYERRLIMPGAGVTWPCQFCYGRGRVCEKRLKALGYRLPEESKSSEDS